MVVAVEPCRSCASAVNASRRLSIVVAACDASHTFLIVLWDNQTHLGAALHPGDTLIMDCPYLNVRDSANSEHQAIFDESPGHASHLFMEYGSSTILFVVPAQTFLAEVVTQPNKVAFTAPVDPVTKFSNLAGYPLPLDEWTALPENCYNAAFLGQVAHVHVGHASPLRQQFAATYFGVNGMASSLADTSPTVVLTLRSLQPPFPLLSIEVTGADQVACALATCDVGHLVLAQNVVLVKSGHTTMGLCADWSLLHPAFSNGHVVFWNVLRGYLNSPDFYSVILLSQLRPRTTSPSTVASPLAVVRVSFVSSEWLEPSATTIIHRGCRRKIHPPKKNDAGWTCDFCNVSWSDARRNIAMGFSSLAIQMEDGSASVRAVMDSRSIDQLLGCTAMAFDQLPSTDQTALVNQTCSAGLVYVAIVSPCPSVHNIVWRIDQAIPLDSQVPNQIIQLTKA
ncbi:hypothetical protein DYB32_003557 [Aphanomyces invadans]|uniref:Cell division control protein 24 OB domain-containing protein n=1 Tax=Aphanomyces invadans TaxID=157072 RepID=A0A3R6VD31_9STRA|nr:hypothetical protein DYB32_003557 [Aphanomyces invadans]